MSDKSEACPMCGTPVNADVEEINKPSLEAQPKPEIPVPNEQPTKTKEEAVPAENDASTTTPPPITPSDKPAKKSNKTPIKIGVVAAVVVIAVLAVLFLMRGHKEDPQEILAEEAVIYNDGNSTQFGNNDENASYNSNESKLKGYEWLEGVWVGCDEYGSFGRMIVTDSYYQVVNSNMDDAFDQVEDMPKQDIELKNRPDYITGEGNSVSFGFDEYIRVDVEHRSIYIVQGEYNGIVLQKIQENNFEAAVFEANHSCPPRVYSNAYDGFVNIRQAPESKAPILGVLRNGPEGAVLLDEEGEWKKIDCNGIVGYVYGEYVQDTPTEVFEYWAALRKDASIYQFTENDLSPLTVKELTYLRNSIYAKHGYVFNSQELNNYFKQISWYHPNVSVTDAVLNDMERANVEFIKNYQERNGKTYKPQ